VSRVGQVPSIVHTPEANVNSRPSVLEALVKPLQLGDLVSSLQYQLGYDAVMIHCAVIDGAAGPGLQMVVVVSQPNEPPTNIKLAEADGDAAALVERGSRLALELVSPYRVALTDFWGGRHGVTAQLARKARCLDGRGVLRKPSLERRSELEDREEKRDEHRDGECGLKRRETSVVRGSRRQRTACIWLTRAWRRATSPLFQAVTPITRVPSTTAAPMMYSIVASPASTEQKRRSTDVQPPSRMRRGWPQCFVFTMVRSTGTEVPVVNISGGRVPCWLLSRP